MEHGFFDFLANLASRNPDANPLGKFGAAANVRPAELAATATAEISGVAANAIDLVDGPDGTIADGIALTLRAMDPFRFFEETETKRPSPEASTLISSLIDEASNVFDLARQKMVDLIFEVSINPALIVSQKVIDIRDAIKDATATAADAALDAAAAVARLPDVFEEGLVELTNLPIVQDVVDLASRNRDANPLGRFGADLAAGDFAAATIEAGATIADLPGVKEAVDLASRNRDANPAGEFGARIMQGRFGEAIEDMLAAFSNLPGIKTVVDLGSKNPDANPLGDLGANPLQYLQDLIAQALNWIEENKIFLIVGAAVAGVLAFAFVFR